MSAPPREPVAPDVPEGLVPVVESEGLVDARLELRAFEASERAGADARGLHLVEAVLRDTDLGDALLSRARFRDVLVSGGSWANAQAADMSLGRVRFEHVRFTGADLSGSAIEDVAFVGCRIDLCSFRFARLDAVRFEDCRVTGSELHGAQLTSVSFVDCDLSEIVLTDARFTRCEMRGCNLTGALDVRQLRGVRMPWPDVIGAAAELATGIGIEILED